MTVESIDPSKDAQWDSFVVESRHGSIYHLSSWREVILKSFGAVPFYLVVKDENGSIRAGLPFFFVKSILTGKRLVSLPLASFCDPLFDNANDFDELLNVIVRKSIELNTSFIEIKTLNECTFLNERRFKCSTDYQTHILSLDRDLNAIEKSFHDNVKRCLKKTKREDVTVREAATNEDIKLFFKLHVATRKKHGLLPQPLGFFKNMWEILHPKALCSFLLVIYRDRVIAGGVFLKFKDTFSYEYGASNERFLGLYPNHILLWEAVKSAHKEKFKFFDFGRSSVENKGLTIFKQKWGGEAKHLYYYYYPDIGGVAAAKAGENKYSLIKQVSRLIPSPIMETVGAYLYKYFI
jgi:hypothetical protein